MNNTGNLVDNRSLRRPIKVGILFSVFTILLYEFGIYKYQLINPILLNIFLLVANIMMYVGFISGAQKSYSYRFDSSISINVVIKALFWISLVVAIPKFMIFTGVRSFSISEIVGRMMYASHNALEVYMEKNELRSVTGIWVYINYLNVLVGPLYWAYMLLSMYFWKNLSTLKKLGTLLIWFLYIAQYVVCGTNVGVFLFVINYGIVYLVRRNREGIGRKLKVSEKIGIIVIVVFVFVLLAAYFNMTMSSRIDDNIESKRAILDTNSFLWRITPAPFHELLAYFTRYLASAYQALDFSFSIPFDSTLGVGHSFFLLDNIDPERDGWWMRTYNMKMDQLFHWDYYTNWHTPYVWFANDVSLFGVPFLLFILLRYFGKAWRKFMVTGNVISFLVEFISFISANNLVFQQSDTMMAFWLLLILNKTIKNKRWVLSPNAI